MYIFLILNVMNFLLKQDVGAGHNTVRGHSNMWAKELRRERLQVYLTVVVEVQGWSLMCDSFIGWSFYLHSFTQGHH